VVNVSSGIRLCVWNDGFRHTIRDIPYSESSQTMHYFRYSGVHLTMNQFTLIKTKCGGLSCDALGVHYGGNRAYKCACYKADERGGSIIGLYDFTVKKDDTEFDVEYHTSKSLFLSQIKDGFIPRGVSPEEVNQNRNVTLSLSRCMRTQFEFVNNYCGGFIVEGWVKRGNIVDQGIYEEYTKKKVIPVVENTSLTYHLTSIKVVNDGVRVDDRNALKFDFFKAYRYYSDRARRTQLEADLPDFSVGRNVAQRADVQNDDDENNGGRNLV